MKAHVNFATERGNDDKDVNQEGMKKAREQFSELYLKRTDFMKEEMTGFVWLQLQK